MAGGWSCILGTLRRAMTTTVEPRYLSIRSLAVILNVSIARVRGLLRRRELRGLKVGGTWRVPIAEFERFVGAAPQEPARRRRG